MCFQEIGDNGCCVWGNQADFTKIDARAKWIWTADSNDEVCGCRYTPTDCRMYYRYLIFMYVMFLLFGRGENLVTIILSDCEAQH